MPTKTRPRERTEEKLTPDQIAREYQVSKDRVLNCIKRGWLAAEELPRGYRIDREALNRFLADKPWLDEG